MKTDNGERKNIVHLAAAKAVVAKKVVIVISIAAAALALAMILGTFSCRNPLQDVIERYITPRYPLLIIKVGTTELASASGSYDFGSVQVGTSKEVNFIVENDGENTLTLAGDPLVAIGGTDAADFAVTAMPGTTLEPGATATFSMTFTPSSEAVKNGLLSIKSNDEANAEYTVALTGTGTAMPLPEISVTQNSVTYASGSTYDFGGAIVSTAKNITFSINNTGQGELNLTGAQKVAISGTNAGDFSVITPPSTPVPAGGISTFTVQLDAALTGGKTAVLTLANDDPDEGTYVVNITATVTAVPEPEINIKQGGDDLGDGTGTYGFGNVLKDGDGGTASSWVEFTIENKGNADLTISSVLIAFGDTTDFDLNNTTVSPVAANGSTTFSIRFDPLITAGSKSAIVQINNNDSDENPYTFTITGTAFTTPTLTTTTVTDITSSTATSGGNITSDGYASVTARGVCWSTSTYPIIDGNPNKTTDESGTGIFTSSITGLTSGTTYYVRAYATNAAGTAYGDQISFVTEYAVRGPGPAGGIIFYDKGDYTGGWRWLEAAPVSTEWTKEWGAYGTNISGADGTAVGTGELNTAQIYTYLGPGIWYAAQVCADLSYGGYEDWFLPSRDELSWMKTNLYDYGLGGFPTSATYLSSSEYNDWDAYYYQFTTLGGYGHTAKNSLFSVRAIRAF